MAFDFLQAGKQRRGIKFGRYYHSCIRKTAQRRAHRAGLHSSRMREHIYVIHLQRSYRLRDDAVWRANDRMWLI
jgi:hypothetical protein